MTDARANGSGARWADADSDVPYDEPHAADTSSAVAAKCNGDAEDACGTPRPADGMSAASAASASPLPLAAGTPLDALALARSSFGGPPPRRAAAHDGDTPSDEEDMPSGEEEEGQGGEEGDEQSNYEGEAPSDEAAGASGTAANAHEPLHGPPQTGDSATAAARYQPLFTNKHRAAPWDREAADLVLLPVLLRVVEASEEPLELRVFKERAQAELGYSRTLNTPLLLAYLGSHPRSFRIEKVKAHAGSKNAYFIGKAGAQSARAAAPARAARPAATAAAPPAQSKPPPPPPARLAAVPAHADGGGGAPAVGTRLELAHALLLALMRTQSKSLVESGLEAALPPLQPTLARDVAAAGSLFDLCVTIAAGRVAALGGTTPGTPRRLLLRTVSGAMPLASRAVTVQTERELLEEVALATLNAPQPGLRLSQLWDKVPPVPPDLRELLGFDRPRGLSTWVHKHAAFFQLTNEHMAGGILVPHADFPPLPSAPPKGPGAARGKAALAGASRQPSSHTLVQPRAQPPAQPLVQARAQPLAPWASQVGALQRVVPAQPQAVQAARPPEPRAEHKSIRELTSELGLSKYAAVLEENDVDLPTLLLLTTDDFRQMGISSIGAQRKLQAAAAALDGTAHVLGASGAPHLRYAASATTGPPGVRQPANGAGLRQPTPKDYMSVRQPIG